MLLGRFYTFLCKLFYISRPRLPPWAVYFILMPWASVWGLCVSKRALRARGSGFFRFAPSHARGGFQVFAPLCGPLRGYFRAFPAGVISFPALPVKAGFPPSAGQLRGPEL